MIDVLLIDHAAHGFAGPAPRRGMFTVPTGLNAGSSAGAAPLAGLTLVGHGDTPAGISPWAIGPVGAFGALGALGAFGVIGLASGFNGAVGGTAFGSVPRGGRLVLSNVELYG
jgi:hypothetical protein